MSDNNLKIFEYINNFVKDLTLVYKTNKALRLYNRLIDKTTIAHKTSIEKHISIFKEFFDINKSVIFDKDHKKLIKHRILYNDNVYIDIFLFVEQGDQEIRNAIWKHLFAILYQIDPSSTTLQLLKDNIQTNENKDNDQETAEEKLISSLFNKLETTSKPDSQPMDIINNIMQSGMLTDVMGKMQNGELNFPRLLNATKKVMSKVSNPDDPQTKQALDMLSMMGSMMGNGENPNMGGMMSMLSGMMGGMGNMSGMSNMK